MSERTETQAGGDQRVVSRWRIEIVGDGRKRSKRCALGLLRVGTDDSNDLVLGDRKVSRHHVEIALRPDGVGLRDLGSKNGTFYLGSRVQALELSVAGGTIALGDTELVLSPDDEPALGQPSKRERCGDLVGRSLIMRRLFAQIEQVAESDVTVLLQGETGTGKELVAGAIHSASPRRRKPFVVVDCAAIPTELIESQLFGHVRGAFSGAIADRRGAFAEADGGTLFLDEIGELPIALQPRLLRALESRTVKPVGSDRPIEIDVRIISASLRDLGAEVRAKRFRQDLYFRLSVLRLSLPPLRERLEDLPVLCDHMLRAMQAAPLGADALKTLTAYAWPGNVRQLRNVLQSAAALAAGGPLSITPDLFQSTTAAVQEDRRRLYELPYKSAKEAMVDGFTREYLEALLARHDGNISAAAREAELDRNWVAELAKRLGLHYKR
jgi:transcriptional regulator with GAF, ATPase, and Fis domain